MASSNMFISNLSPIINTNVSNFVVILVGVMKLNFLKPSHGASMSLNHGSGITYERYN